MPSYVRDLSIEYQGIIASRLYFKARKEGKTESEADNIYHACKLYTLRQVHNIGVLPIELYRYI